jgi:hypothetical protein
MNIALAGVQMHNVPSLIHFTSRQAEQRSCFHHFIDSYCDSCPDINPLSAMLRVLLPPQAQVVVWIGDLIEFRHNA